MPPPSEVAVFYDRLQTVAARLRGSILDHIMTTSIDQALQRGAARLRENQDEAPSDSDTLDAAVLLCAVLGCTRVHLIAHGDAVLDGDASRRFEDLIERRAAGEPVAYLLGQREFWSLALTVTPDTLIPRPDTETLVQAALDWLPEAGPAQRIVDLGTGSGAIALALAVERPRATIVATDRSERSLQVAQRNGAMHAPGRVTWHQGSWFDALPGFERFSMIVSNPPYVNDDDPHLDRGDVRFEPRSALTAGRDGLNDLRVIVAQASKYLDAGGALLVEHGADQGDAVAALFADAGFRQVEGVLDLAGKTRVTRGRWL